MMYDSLLARSFSKHEQRKLGYGALLACLLMAFSFFSFFKPYLGPPQVNLRLSVGTNQKLQMVNDTILPQLIAEPIIYIVNETSKSQVAVREMPKKNVEKTNYARSSQQRETVAADTSMKNTQVVDDSSHQTAEKEEDDVTRIETEPLCSILDRSDFCEMKGDVRIDGKTGTVYVVSSEREILASENASSWSIRPYGRKGDIAAMSMVRNWKVKLVANSHNIPKCTQNHNVTGILFSIGGYSGNHFHAFSDIIVPLFATARPFNGEVQLLITDKNQQPGWVSKFETLLKGLSRHEFIDIDNQQADIQCFPSAIVGLKHRSTKELYIDPTKSSYTMNDFTGFLRSAYSLTKFRAIKLSSRKRKPRLLIIARKKSRAFTNIGEIDRMARRLGFKTVVAEPNGDLSKVAQIMNSCDVVLGVHGAGLTNTVFLAENAILIQVVPFGGAEWLSTTYFEEPSKGMSLRYLDYKIKLEESTLARQYPPDHVVLRDPSVIQKQGWEAYKSIYLDKQNINLDVNRFRPTLEKALGLLRQ